jgi:universal stress protein A
MPYTHILTALDLTDECVSVFDRARELAQHYGAKLSIVHIIEPMSMAFGGDIPLDLSLIQKQQFEQSRELLKKFVAKHPEISESQQHMSTGNPREEIHRLAQEQACDLIVVGSHGRHGLALLLGSTAKDLLQSAPCDVLAVRLKKTD